MGSHDGLCSNWNFDIKAFQIKTPHNTGVIAKAFGTSFAINKLLC